MFYTTVNNKRLQSLIFEKPKSQKFKVLLICTTESPSFQHRVIREMCAGGAQRRGFTVVTFLEVGGFVRVFFGATEIVGHKEKTFRSFQGWCGSSLWQISNSTCYMRRGTWLKISVGTVRIEPGFVTQRCSSVSRLAGHHFTCDEDVKHNFITWLTQYALTLCVSGVVRIISWCDKCLNRPEDGVRHPHSL